MCVSPKMPAPPPPPPPPPPPGEESAKPEDVSIKKSTEKRKKGVSALTIRRDTAGVNIPGV